MLFTIGLLAELNHSLIELKFSVSSEVIYSRLYKFCYKSTAPHPPCTLNTSTYSRASFLTSSHQITGSSSALHVPSDNQSSLLPTSKNLIPITSPPMTSPNSNLTSDDLMGIINGNLPECYIFRMIFSRQQKNSLIINMGIKYGDIQYTLIEAFQKRVLLILKWNPSWRRSTFFMKKPTMI